MVLRSASITSWLEKGNHGDTTISTPSSMPNQSSHVRCLLKKRKPDIVDLPLKRGIRRRPRSQHFRYRTRPGRFGAVCHGKDVGTAQPLQGPPAKILRGASGPPWRRTLPLQALVRRCAGPISSASRNRIAPASSRSPVCICGFMSPDMQSESSGNLDMAAVRDNKAQSRFELDVEGAVAFANYRLTPSAVIITHTETPRALRGRGIASELVKGALELIRADGRKVIAGCGFVVDYLHKNPEFSRSGGVSYRRRLRGGSEASTRNQRFAAREVPGSRLRSTRNDERCSSSRDPDRHIRQAFRACTAARRPSRPGRHFPACRNR